MLLHYLSKIYTCEFIHTFLFKYFKSCLCLHGKGVGVLVIYLLWSRLCVCPFEPNMMDRDWLGQGDHNTSTFNV